MYVEFFFVYSKGQTRSNRHLSGFLFSLTLVSAIWQIPLILQPRLGDALTVAQHLDRLRDNFCFLPSWRSLAFGTRDALGKASWVYQDFCSWDVFWESFKYI